MMALDFRRVSEFQVAEAVDVGFVGAGQDGAFVAVDGPEVGDGGGWGNGGRRVVVVAGWLGGSVGNGGCGGAVERGGR